jgi:2-polyprenyl-3-methyl-5-hydroxy-6-metoxy-1,4-benzoquinol methylase
MNQDRVMEFLGRVVVDSGAPFAGLSTAIGVRTGLYKAMSGAGPLTSDQLSDRTGLVERYVREWLAAQVAGGYVLYDRENGTYWLPDEHASVLADAFRTGAEVGWREHGPSLFEGVASFFYPGYAASLVQEWLPALDGVVEKLERGASVADVGCGYGYSTLMMAQAFPESQFHGVDFHGPSIERARKQAVDLGLSDRVSFDVADRAGLPR